MKRYYVVFSLFLCMAGVAANAQIKRLHSFDTVSTNGAYPGGALTLVGNELFGTGYYGGTNQAGVIFSIQTNGSGYKNIWNFNYNGSTNGAYSEGTLIYVNKKLYGMTGNGGINGYGNIFSIDTNGTNYKDLWDFSDTTGTNGILPFADLTYAQGKLYGTTYNGGVDSDGNVFSIDTSGQDYKDLVDFNTTNGAAPDGDVTLVGKVLYGMTSAGGAYGYGNIFSVDTDGSNFEDRLDFNDTNGSTPYGSLLSYGKKLYGMTYAGGAGYGDGVIFSVDTDGSSYNGLLYFNTVNGENPIGSLIRSGNLLYGMSYQGIVNNADGNIFSIDTNGTQFNNIYSFNYTDGANPVSNVILSNGVLYGMTLVGGGYGFGAIFSDAICNLLTVTPDSVPDNGSNNGAASVTASVGPTPYTYLWAPDGQTTSSISGLSAGTYTCTVTDANGCQKASEVIVTSPAGVNNITANTPQIRPYPNPNDGKFTLQMNSAAMSNRTLQVQFYNIIGEQVYSQFSTGNASLLINLSNQPGGLYLYRVMDEKGELVGQGKVVIQK